MELSRSSWRGDGSIAGSQKEERSYQPAGGVTYIQPGPLFTRAKCRSFLLSRLAEKRAKDLQRQIKTILLKSRKGFGVRHSYLIFKLLRTGVKSIN